MIIQQTYIYHWCYERCENWDQSDTVESICNLPEIISWMRTGCKHMCECMCSFKSRKKYFPHDQWWHWKLNNYWSIVAFTDIRKLKSKGEHCSALNTGCSYFVNCCVTSRVTCQVHFHIMLQITLTNKWNLEKCINMHILLF